jgi:F420H(2)-dependent quinone reductase
MPLTGEYKPSTSDWARRQAEAFEESNGARANLLRGVPIIVLTSVGAKTGGLRKTALMRVEHGGRYLAVASKGGHPEPPAWYWNVKRNPHVELQDADVKRDYLARELSGDERAEWWARAVEVWPDYDNYQTRTDRLIAIFLLEPVDELEPVQE